jgi:ATP-dependent Lhr-like helicase
MKERAKTDNSVYESLLPPIREALVHLGFRSPSPPQTAAIPKILEGVDVLIIAPAGTGKTEAAILPVLHNFLGEPRREGISILYITPMRALNRDLAKRLSFWGNRLNLRVEVRHGDTSIKIRRRQAKAPPDLLVTTPETLQAILPGRLMQKHLKKVRWVIIDEIHELAESKRGAQLTLGLERLREIIGEDFQRIGVSATISEPEKIAKFLSGNNRRSEIIQTPVERTLEYRVEYPFPTEEDYELAPSLYTTPESTARINRMRELLQGHRSTLIFVNSRTNAEMLGNRLSMVDNTVRVHHGSLSREERTQVEEDLKTGKIKGIICTSTLELGIDVGTVDLVLQHMSPRQISPFVQRVGRSGHRLGEKSTGIVISVSPEDILESAVVVQKATAMELEEIRIHENALDVLAHQIVGLTLDVEKVSEKTIYETVKRSYPYRKLKRIDFHEVLKYLQERRFLFSDGEMLTRSRRGREYYYSCLSMIPDEIRYVVIDLSTNRFIGSLGDEFVKMKATIGLNFICKGRVWKIRKIENRKVYTTPVEDPTGAIPGWDGEMLPITEEIARGVGRLRRKVSEEKRSGRENQLQRLSSELRVEKHGIKTVLAEIERQLTVGVPIPDDNTILVESYNQFIIIHICGGERINRTLSYIFDHLFSQRNLVRSIWSDAYRILIETQTPENDLDEIVDELFLHSADDVSSFFEEYVERRFPYSYYLKFVAERFGAIPRGRALGEKSLTDLSQRLRDTPIYVETLREVLQEKADVQGVKRIYRNIEEGKTKIVTHQSRSKPSPIASHIINKFFDVPELIAEETLKGDSLHRMKEAITNEHIRLLCMNCGKTQETIEVGNLKDNPQCEGCGSRLLTILGKTRWDTPNILYTWLKRMPLEEAQRKTLTRARQIADLIAVYGRKATIALTVTGIGPQTASRILAKMHYTEDEFYKDLLEAKLRYITTREYWD